MTASRLAVTAVAVAGALVPLVWLVWAAADLAADAYTRHERSRFR